MVLVSKLVWQSSITGVPIRLLSISSYASFGLPEVFKSRFLIVLTTVRVVVASAGEITA